MTAVLDVHALKTYYRVKGGTLFGKPAYLHAVDDVSFSVARGETLAIVGESGCGKSTLGRTILRFVDPAEGNIWLNGHRITEMGRTPLRKLRRQMQVVFQDPASSLSPRMRVRDIIAEPLRNFGIATGKAELADRVGTLLEQVGLPRDAGNRFAHEFSGGQRQRIAIARALAPEPDIVICDEAVSALDVSSKAQIINLLTELQRRLGLAFLFISHDLAVVEHIADRVAVMYLGKIVEIGPREAIFTAPAHPYTQALLSAVLDPSPRHRRQRIALKGEIPSPVNPPSGCRFHTRCPLAFDRCHVEAPDLRERNTRQASACHLDSLPSPA